MSDVCYRVCNRNGWSKYATLDDLDAYLTKQMHNGYCFWPIKRIVKVTSEDVPFTETVRKYNDLIALKEKGDAK